MPDIPVRTNDGHQPDETDGALVGALVAATEAARQYLDEQGIEGSAAILIGLSVRFDNGSVRVVVGQGGRGLDGFKLGPLFTGLAKQILEDVLGGSVELLAVTPTPPPGNDPRMN